MRLDEHLQVLPRLERRDGEDVRDAEVGRRPVDAVDGLRCGMRDADPLGGHAEGLRHVASRVRRVHEDDVAGRGGVSVLAAVHRSRARGRPLGMMERHEVVDRRRADTRALRRVHPVREVQRVERAEEPLGSRTPEPAPGSAHRMREGQRPGSDLDVDPLERRADPLGAADARRREGDDLVPSRRCLGEPGRASPGCSSRSRAAGATRGSRRRRSSSTRACRRSDRSAHRAPADRPGSRRP